MKTIVVGYDGSEESSDALALGVTLAEGLGGSLVVAVIDELHVFVPTTLNSAKKAEYLKVTLDRAKAELGDREFREETMWGSVPECLGLITESVHGDLLVIGSAHRGDVGRVVPGSVGDRLLAGSPCAVAVAPRGYARSHPQHLDRIAVGFDGEEESREAVRVASHIAIALAAALRLIAVAPAPVDSLTGISWGPNPPYSSFLHEQLGAELARASADLPSSVEVSGEVVDGSPADVLRDRSAEVDLLVLGSRGYGPLRRVLLGGVSSKVLHGSRCPVLVTPRSSRRSRVAGAQLVSTGHGS